MDSSDTAYLTVYFTVSGGVGNANDVNTPSSFSGCLLT